MLKNEEKIGFFYDFVLARTGFVNGGKIRDDSPKVRRSFYHKKSPLANCWERALTVLSVRK
jgi:hypothetical protein